MLRTLIIQTKNYAKQHTRQYAQAHRYRPNLGIRRQAKAETNDIECDVIQWDDDLSKYEGDLSNTADTYKQYEEESREEREKVRRNVVRNKYFDERNPAFLTWAEMEQIRLLNNNDPEEWDEQKLAESFPADAVTIRKVLKAKWQPRDAKRIAKHDEMVRSNWKAFVNGEFEEMDHRFNEHLRKFSARNLDVKVNYDSVLKREMPEPKSKEFFGIITSCKNYQAEPKQITSNQITNNPTKRSSGELVAAQTVDSHKLYAFKPSKSENSGTAVSSAAETIFDNPSGIGGKQRSADSMKQKPTPKSVNPFSVTKYESNEVQLQAHDFKQLSVSSIRPYITIPEKLFREGATYRLEDCYYDDDGEFLYRVPGMTKF